MDLGLRDTEGDLGSFFQLLVVLVLQTGTCGFEVLSSMPSLYKVLLFSSLRLYASDSCRSGFQTIGVACFGSSHEDASVGFGVLYNSPFLLKLPFCQQKQFEICSSRGPVIGGFRSI